jgi:hypothetical protein
MIETVIPQKFKIKVLGRTLEHLGVQMYKRRDIAIAELVANCWDAGAKNVWINIPEEQNYDRSSSIITISDDGFGMNETQIQENYLVIGRNRREEDDGEIDIEEEEQGSAAKRMVMGRKGIGKLAGFGIASVMTVLTWKNNSGTEFILDLVKLKLGDGIASDVDIPSSAQNPPEGSISPNGTRISLSNLKHKTALKRDDLQEALARRFSRTVRGRMAIYINAVPLGDPNIELETRFPDDENSYTSDTLTDGKHVSYYYAYAKQVISSAQLRGFTIYVRGKTAQAPPFFFNVEGTASGQHATRYVTGAIEADFLDVGKDDDSDLVSTDRQEIDWEEENIKPLKEWGDKLTRQILRDWVVRKGKQMVDTVYQDESLRRRILKLDPASQKQIDKFLQQLAQVETDPHSERTIALADSLVSAYEFRHFHDVISELESVEDDPEKLQALLAYLVDWKVLESRAILEVIKGRIDIIEKFHTMITTDVPETPSKKSSDSMHDLVAQYPWIINPTWQVLSEEKTISSELKKMFELDISEEELRQRYDFIGLTCM